MIHVQPPTAIVRRELFELMLEQGGASGLLSIGIEVLEKTLAGNPANVYRTWLAGALQSLGKPFFAAQ